MLNKSSCIQGAALPLSTDHTADVEAERQRIIQAGGHVSHVMGNWRIGRAGIQVSRSVTPQQFPSQPPVLLCAASCKHRHDVKTPSSFTSLGLQTAVLYGAASVFRMAEGGCGAVQVVGGVDCIRC